jgi:hypothetical protein
MIDFTSSFQSKLFSSLLQYRSPVIKIREKKKGWIAPALLVKNHHAAATRALILRVALVAIAAGVRPECRGRTAIVGILLLEGAVARALAVHRVVDRDAC